MKTLFPCLFILFLAACQPVRATNTVEQLWRVLADENLITETNDASRAMAEALLKSVDPKARLLSLEEAETLKQSLAAPGGEHDPTATTSSGVDQERLGAFTLLRAEELPEDIGYLHVQGLYKESAAVINARIEEWSLKGLASIVIDLRAAEGTYYESISGIMGHYVPKETELYNLVDAAGEKSDTVRTRHTTSYRMPTVILIDSYTSGASRALAAVMKAQNAALLVGQPASDDNRVRSFIPLSGASPNVPDRVLYIGNRFIKICGSDAPEHKVTAPDIVVDPDESPRKVDAVNRPADEALSEEIERDRQLAERVDWDPELRRGVDYLLGLKALGLRGLHER